MISNLNRAVSKYQNIKYFTGALNRQTILDNIKESGYCLYRDTNLQNDLFAQDDATVNKTNKMVNTSLFGDNYAPKLMDYEIGTDARDKYKNSKLMSVSKISSSHWVPYHNELLYTNEFPKTIAFICISNDCTEGGYTPWTNSIATYYQFSDAMRTKFDKYGVKYIRNLRDQAAEESIPNNPIDLAGQKTMQEMFGTNEETKLQKACDDLGYDIEWAQCPVNKTPILRIKYTMTAIVEYELNGSVVRSFANSVQGMNGRYFTNYDEIYDNMDYIDRPFHTQWGNGDEFTENEYNTISEIWEENSIKFEWKPGDIFIGDNIAWAHGRSPYKGSRNILALMGDPYVRYPFMISPKPLK